MATSIADRESQILTKNKEGFPREIASGIFWLGGCFSMRADDGKGYDTGGFAEIHSHMSSFLIVGTEKALMIDTGAPTHWNDLSLALDQILGSRTLDWVVPTHWEVPHSGNLERILRKFPECSAGGDLRDYHLAHPGFADRIHILEHGHKIELGGGYRFEILPAPIKDLVNSIWGFEEHERVLFTSDGFGYSHHVEDLDADELYIHHPGECSLLSEELGVYPTVEQALFLTKHSLYWTRYTPTSAFFDQALDLFTKYRPKLIAPAHGNVISDIARMLPVVKEAHDIAYVQSTEK